MVFPRDVLNELKWRDDKELSNAWITYEHRGAPCDEVTISGASIVQLGRSFFSTGTSHIPYHRIIRIVYEGDTLFEVEERE